MAGNPESDTPATLPARVVQRCGRRARLMDVEAEIATVLRIGQSAVRSTTSRGLAALARTLGEEG